MTLLSLNHLFKGPISKYTEVVRVRRSRMNWGGKGEEDNEAHNNNKDVKQMTMS